MFSDLFLIVTHPNCGIIYMGNKCANVVRKVWTLPHIVGGFESLLCILTRLVKRRRVAVKTSVNRRPRQYDSPRKPFDNSVSQLVSRRFTHRPTFGDAGLRQNRASHLSAKLPRTHARCWGAYFELEVLWGKLFFSQRVQITAIIDSASKRS